MRKRLRPSKAEIRTFLQSAIVDPNKQEEYIIRQFVEQGTSEYFEVRVMEYMAEARRLRARIEAVKGIKERVTLVESYRDTMRRAATAIAISVGKIDETFTPETPKGTGSDHPGSNRDVPPSQGVGGTGNAREPVSDGIS